MDSHKYCRFSPLHRRLVLEGDYKGFPQAGPQGTDIYPYPATAITTRAIVDTADRYTNRVAGRCQIKSDRAIATAGSGGAAN
jgi:hypothetical protein